MPLKGGAAKALRAMRKRYGKKKGTAVFYAKANKYGKRGQPIDKKARSVYKKGGKLRRK
jgi:hypothetical protein